MIHPKDAIARNMADGDMAKVSNHVGTVELAAEVSEDVMPGVVSIPHGYGHARKGIKLSVAASKPGVSINDLTDPALKDPLSGNAVLNGVPVVVERA
jgi:anaerobic selenocysteine-containing dehydrogenase